jgi:hypothetical protein
MKMKRPKRSTQADVVSNAQKTVSELSTKINGKRQSVPTRVQAAVKASAVRKRGRTRMYTPMRSRRANLATTMKSYRRAVSFDGGTAEKTYHSSPEGRKANRAFRESHWLFGQDHGFREVLNNSC